MIFRELKKCKKQILAANQMRHLAKLARLQHMNYLDSHTYINNKYITDIP